MNLVKKTFITLIMFIKSIDNDNVHLKALFSPLPPIIQVQTIELSHTSTHSTKKKM